MVDEQIIVMDPTVIVSTELKPELAPEPALIQLQPTVENFVLVLPLMWSEKLVALVLLMEDELPINTDPELQIASTDNKRELAPEPALIQLQPTVEKDAKD